MTSSYAQRSLPPSLQQASSMRHAGPTSQSGYYNVHQRNAAQSFGINSGHPFGSSFQSNSRSANLQTSHANWNNFYDTPQTLCSTEPGPTLQNAYDNVEQGTVIQWNNQQQHALNNGQSFSTSSQPSSGSTNSQTSSVTWNNLCDILQTVNSGEPRHTSQILYDNVEQRTLIQSNNIQHLALSNRHHSLHSTNLQSCQSPQVRSTGPQNQSLYRSPEVHVRVSFRPPWQNGAAQFQQMQPVQRVHVNQNQMDTFRNGASHEPAPWPSAASQVPTAPAQPPGYWNNQNMIRKSQAAPNVNLFPNSKSLNQCQTSSNRTHNISVAQNQSNSFPNGSPNTVSWKASVPQHKAQSQIYKTRKKRQATPYVNTAPISCHNGVPSFPAHQYNTEPQGQLSNGTVSVLTRSKDTSLSRSSPASQAPLSADSRSNNYTRVSLVDLLLQEADNIPLSTTSRSFRAQAAEDRSGPRQTIEGHTTTVADLSQTPVSNQNVNPSTSQGVIQMAGTTPKRLGALDTEQATSVERTVEGAQFERLQTEKGNLQMSDKSPGEIEYCTNPADCLDLVIALKRAVRQVGRATALVPPIVQQPQQMEGQEEDYPKSADNSLPFKIGAVWSVGNYSECVATDTKAASLSGANREKHTQIASVPLPQIQESIKSGNGPAADTYSCEMPRPEKTPTLGSQTCNIPNSEISVIPQAPLCLNDLTVENPSQQSNNPNVETSSDEAKFDLSMAPMTDFTLEKLQDLVKSLDAASSETEKKTPADARQSIIDLYWGGDVRNLMKFLRTFTIQTISSSVYEFGMKEDKDVVFRFLEPEVFRKLSPILRILESDVTSPAQFRPWWKIEGMPADIDKVLAEPLSNYDFTWGKFDPVNTASNLVEVSRNDAEGLVVSTQKESSVATSEDIALSSVDHEVQNSGTNAEDLDVSTQTDASMETPENIPVNSVNSLVQTIGTDAEDLVVSMQTDTSMETPDNIPVNSVDSLVQTIGTDAEDLVVSTQTDASMETPENIPVNSVDSLVQTIGTDAEDLVVSMQTDASMETPENIPVNSVDSLVQTIGTDAEDLVVSTQKELSVATSETVTLSPVDHRPDVVPETKMSGGQIKSIQKEEYKTKDHKDSGKYVVSPPLIPKSNPSDLLEQKVQTGNDQTPTEISASPLLLSDFDPLENDGNSCEKQNISDADCSSDSLQIDFIVLSPDGAKEIFNKCNKLKHSTKHPLNMPSLSQPDNLSTKAVTPPVRVKFTCPHVTDIISDDVHFCTKCWEQTPLLDVNLDDSQSTQNEDESPVTIPLKPLDERSSPQPGEQTQDPVQTSCPVTGRISDAVVFNPRVNDCEMTIAPVEPSVPRIRSVQEPTRAVSLESEKPGVELPKAPPQSQQVRPSLTKKIIHSNSSSKHPPCKKRKHSKTLGESKVDDDLFRLGMVKTGSHKQHSRVQSSASTVDGHRSRVKRKGKESGKEEKRPPIKTTIQVTKRFTQTGANCKEKTFSIKPHASKVIEKSAASQHHDLDPLKEAGQNKNKKLVKFLLYGSRDCKRDFFHRFQDCQKFPSVPVHITVSAADNSGKNYSSMPSAKEKVYNQWRNSFVPKTNSTSCKKFRKECEKELMKRIEMQKQKMKERALFKSQRKPKRCSISDSDSDS
ncbi:uncharacterized protein [Hoplias malabaricus]|uniref:uncharacterized protein n=1 Tax=Hoplias malabaricus TaxID=27720 RepID=UPI0034623676